MASEKNTINNILKAFEITIGKIRKDISSLSRIDMDKVASSLKADFTSPSSAGLLNDIKRSAEKIKRNEETILQMCTSIEEIFKLENKFNKNNLQELNRYFTEIEKLSGSISGSENQIESNLHQEEEVIKKEIEEAFGYLNSTFDSIQWTSEKCTSAFKEVFNNKFTELKNNNDQQSINILNIIAKKIIELINLEINSGKNFIDDNFKHSLENIIKAVQDKEVSVKGDLNNFIKEAFDKEKKKFI